MKDAPDTKVNPTTQQHIAGSQSRLRPFVERFNEQIAEDVMYGITVDRPLLLELYANRT